MGTIDALSSVCSYVHAGLGALASEGKTIAQHMHDDAAHNADYIEKLKAALSNWGHEDWGTFGELLGISVVIGILVAFAIGAVRFVSNKWVSTRHRDTILRIGFGFVWLYGFVVYDVGMCTGQYISLLTNAPMAVIYAFKIFLFDSDVSEIHEPFHSSWVYSLNFALAHFFAAIISTLFLINYFGFNLLARGRMWWTSHRPSKTVSDTYVFWGLNEQTVHLIESIKQRYSEIGSKDYRIVVVRTNHDAGDSPEKRNVIARIFDFLAMPSTELERLRSLGCFSVGSNANLSILNASGSDEDILGSVLRFKSLKRLLEKRTDKKIHLLFLNDDEKENLHDVTYLLNDSTIKNFTEGKPKEAAEYVPSPDNKNKEEMREPKREVIFYCLARYNSIHRVIEDQNMSDKIRVKVVDSSHINVELLKTNTDLLPVNYVTVEKDATVSTEFNALVVGFSEVGMDSVRFLYEFGAFVRHGSTDKDAIRSKFHLDVVDKNMGDLAGAFVANAPAIKPSMPFLKKDGENKDALITLHEMDCRSVQFYDHLRKGWIQKLNYVVIATDDDELNISLGVRIFKAATRYRDDLDKFCILVRAHNDDDGHIDRIARHYNRLWAAYKNAPVDDKGKRFRQNIIKRGQIVDEPIHIFGLDSSTFTYDNIIANTLEENARKYAQKYKETTEPDFDTKISAWDDNINKMMLLTGEYKDYSPTYFGVMCLRRTQAQDMANSLHEKTKRILADEALERCGLKDFAFSRLTREPNTTRYIWPGNYAELTEINRIMITLAQTEHLRWNASHEILGYEFDSNKDEVRFRHDCLRDWRELKEDTQSYDCNVSDFILGISFPK